ncbi:MAG: glycosyltransferase family 2 protein [Acetobacteraceae bacterium]
MDGPALSVCICTHDRPQAVAQCLAALRPQAASLELLVVDSASSRSARRALRHVVGQCRGARLVRLEHTGLSRARNAGAAASSAPWIAYLDDDATPAPDWAAQALTAIAAAPDAGMIGGRVLPAWETALPHWWPASLRGVLSIVEAEGRGPYGSPDLPPGLGPCGANLLVRAGPLRACGGFAEALGRDGAALLSDEETELATRLRAAGLAVRYDSRPTVHHAIAAGRLTPGWLLRRMHWQGVSAARSRRLGGQRAALWREAARRAAVAALFALPGLVSERSPMLIGARWRLAYATGFLRGALGRLPTAGAATPGPDGVAGVPRALPRPAAG